MTSNCLYKNLSRKAFSSLAILGWAFLVVSFFAWPFLAQASSRAQIPGTRSGIQASIFQIQDGLQELIDLDRVLSDAGFAVMQVVSDNLYYRYQLAAITLPEQVGSLAHRIYMFSDSLTQYSELLLPKIIHLLGNRLVTLKACL